jgi:hypothetical protein
MFMMIRVATLGVSSAAIAGVLALHMPLANQGDEQAPTEPAIHASVLGCGYDGEVGGRPTYNHCGVGSVVIKVDHIFWQHTYACMPRGVHTIPQGNVSWAIDGAEYDGHTCTSGQPISVVGP